MYDVLIVLSAVLVQKVTALGVQAGQDLPPSIFEQVSKLIILDI
jgi:hypothetical protein